MSPAEVLGSRWLIEIRRAEPTCDWKTLPITTSHMLFAREVDVNLSNPRRCWVGLLEQLLDLATADVPNNFSPVFIGCAEPTVYRDFKFAQHGQTHQQFEPKRLDELKKLEITSRMHTFIRAASSFAFSTSAAVTASCTCMSHRFVSPLTAPTL